MTTDSFVSFVIGVATAFLVGRAINQPTKDGSLALPFTTATNPALLDTAINLHGNEGMSRVQRLQQLAQSGAITHDEYSALTSSTEDSEASLARLSILHGGPNKIKDIKALRSSFKLGLREAKDIVDNLPQTFLIPMPYTKAANISLQLQSTGMTTHIT